MSTGRIGKGNKCYFLAFFLLLLCLPYCQAQEDEPRFFPVIVRLDPRDTGFRQYINDVENNRRRIAGIHSLRGSGLRSSPQEAAEHLTIYQYTPRPGEDIFSLAARCNIPYSALSSLNRLSNPTALEEGKPVFLPSSPGLFIPANVESDIEKLLAAARFSVQDFVELRINMAGVSETFNFYPGADFTSTERAFFLNAGFRFPLQTFRLTSAYGIRRNPITGNITMHQGLDLAAPEGTDVYAVADGTVTEIGEDPIYGTYIVISHTDRWTSLYGHLQRVEAILRSNVKSGTLIGKVGSTGQSTGPHLHFELRQDGRALDPAGRLRR